MDIVEIFIQSSSVMPPVPTADTIYRSYRTSSSKLINDDKFKYLFAIHFTGYVKSAIFTGVEEIIVSYTGRNLPQRGLQILI